jgi:hypothetical protein
VAFVTLHNPLLASLKPIARLSATMFVLVRQSPLPLVIFFFPSLSFR